MLAALICNVNRGKGKRSMKPEDFFPSLRTRQRGERMSPEEIHAALSGMAAAWDAQRRR